jgi:DNA-binding protein Fis
MQANTRREHNSNAANQSSKPGSSRKNSSQKKSESPIRKQLVKKLITYFDNLEDSKKNDHAVRVLEESAFPYRKSVRGSVSGGSNRKSIKEQLDEEQKIDPYQDVECRQKKL